MSTSTVLQRGSANGKVASRGFFGKSTLFIRQVIDELRKVVHLTSDELVNYTIALLVFLILLMVFVMGLDQLMVYLVSSFFGD